MCGWTPGYGATGGYYRTAKSGVGDQRLVGRYPSSSGRFHKLLGTGQAELGSGHMTLSTGTLW